MLMGGYLDDRLVNAHAFQDGKAIRAWAKEVGVVYKAAGDQHKLQLVARTGKEVKRARGFLAAIVMNNELVSLPKVSSPPPPQPPAPRFHPRALILVIQ